MPTLRARLGTWNIPTFHMWKHRNTEFVSEPIDLVSPSTRIATIGSCFAEELANGLDAFHLNGGMHPAGLFYNSSSIRYEFERIFNGHDIREHVPLWETKNGWVDPFRNYFQAFQTTDALLAERHRIDEQAKQLFKKANVIVITLGLIELWRDPNSGAPYASLPHPEVFDDLNLTITRQEVSDIKEDLEAIYSIISQSTNAKLVVTVSPVPLHTTFTKHDVRVANTHSKGRIVAAVSEFIDAHPDVHYFHSYDLVTTAEVSSDYMMEDGRHVHRHAVHYILSRFLKNFAPTIAIEDVDTSWLTAPSKTAARPRQGNSLMKQVARKVPSQIKSKVPEQMKRTIRTLMDD